MIMGFGLLSRQVSLRIALGNRSTLQAKRYMSTRLLSSHAGSHPSNVKTSAIAAAMFAAGAGAMMTLHSQTTAKSDSNASNTRGLTGRVDMSATLPKTEEAQEHNVISQTNTDPFDTPELRAGLADRSERETQLKMFTHRARNRLFYLNERKRRGELNKSQFETEVGVLKKQVAMEAARVMYGTTASQRQAYLNQFGCTRCTDEAVSVISELGSVVEMGAGQGHWSVALEAAGVDVVAYDNGESDVIGGDGAVKVLRGDIDVLNKHQDRTLLLVYPPPNDMATRCLSAYKGETIVYVGEGRGGCNGDRSFFDVVKRNWEVQNVSEIDPFPQGFEKLYVLKRRQPRSWFSLWYWLGY